MRKTTRYIIGIALLIILIFSLAPIFSMIFTKIFGHSGNSLASVNFGVIIDQLTGIIYSYAFFIPLVITIFFDKPEKYYAILSLLGLLLLVFLNNIPVFVVYLLPTALLGWLLGEGVLWLYNKFKK